MSRLGDEVITEIEGIGSLKNTIMATRRNTRMLDDRSIQDAAKRLDESERGRTQIRQLSLQHQAMTIDDAYAVQKGLGRPEDRRRPRGAGPQDRLTSKAMQYSSNINEPDYGVLLDDMFFADGSSIPPIVSSFRTLGSRVGLRLEQAAAGPELPPSSTS